MMRQRVGRRRWWPIRSEARLRDRLDDAWNGQDINVFRARHKPDVVVRWPFRGTMKGPMVMADGTEVPPTGKSFEVDFYTIAKWHEGQIVEENLMYDLVGFLQQIGLSK